MPLTHWGPPGDQSVLSSPTHGSCCAYTITLWDRFRQQKAYKHSAHLHNNAFEMNRSKEL